LAQIICGIYQPTEGSIYSSWIGFRAVMSFQQPERQFFLDTTYDEVAYGIKGVIGSNISAEEIVRHSMSAAGLDFELFRHRAPHTLSGGEARRLAFAIVIALRADLIIFDEPTCGLDEAGVAAFKKMVETLKGDGKTVMLISHDSDIIADKADRVVFLHHGKLDFIGSPLQFFVSDMYQEVLSIPEIVDYQQSTYGKVFTTHPADVFDMSGFFA
jgi:energy-coupling factor transport system ATP-binding protein